MAAEVSAYKVYDIDPLELDKIEDILANEAMGVICDPTELKKEELPRDVSEAKALDVFKVVPAEVNEKAAWPKPPAIDVAVLLAV